MAIEKLTLSMWHKKYLRKPIFYNELAGSVYDAHSDLSSRDPIELLKRFEYHYSTTWKELSQRHSCHYDLWTAWVYRNNESSNCYLP
jgi:hypothetical protein